ncbi:pyrophosphate--fructose 6-phosphate 1-phosphotransferase subunit alpha-like [Panicum miliaceum]|uniref:Pyrophosphate--fructose 6-phosphate 1-phosphotransferase subunit alpha-like n=1 Tax=Panicum miliaceum TaxID=4540 RepID=A0A3L6PIJ1_PANMI|nr:pyrophosphate--fructose 6-phosphate 1-phosphotransferase subunit alpha-like [Panicum miliaceum]
MGSVAMDSDYGAPRELSALQRARALYQPELPPCLQMGAGWGHPAPHDNSVGRCTSNGPTPVCSAPPSPSALHH